LATNNPSDNGRENAARRLDDSGSSQSESLDNASEQVGTPEYLQQWLAEYYAAMVESKSEIAGRSPGNDQKLRPKSPLENR
jgi:hypothetical protein